MEITAFAPPAEAHARIAYALTEVILIKSQVSVGNARAFFAGEKVPHPGLERRDPSGADEGDGADLDQRRRD